MSYLDVNFKIGMLGSSVTFFFFNDQEQANKSQWLQWTNKKIEVGGGGQVEYCVVSEVLWAAHYRKPNPGLNHKDVYF